MVKIPVTRTKLDIVADMRAMREHVEALEARLEYTPEYGFSSDGIAVRDAQIKRLSIRLERTEGKVAKLKRQLKEARSG